MRTLVFHSVKGGVGRTLALCNLARALASTGRRVLMLDFDFTAPGLHHKWQRPPGPGYLEYLDAFDVEARAGGVSARKRWHLLRDRIEPIDKHLHLLRSGDDTSPDYWRLIASYRFQRLFYFAPKEINGLSPRVFPLEWLDLNREAFDADKQLIADHFKPDYLLVDCKTTTEPSAVILLSWADAIAHFLPANPEGIQYACGTAQAVVREMARQRRPVGFVPVIARVPDHRDRDLDADRIRTIRETWRDRHWSDQERGYAAGLFREQDFVLLSETREIEGQERILFEQRKEKDILRQLSHDYLGLCARLAPPADHPQDPAAAEAWWYKQLGMRRDARILAKQFDNYPHQGTLLNVDEQPHIAMRVRTFHLLLEGLLEACRSGGPDARRNALVTVGRRCGRDFAAELNDIFREEGIEVSFSMRIERWAEFDSGVGIGVIQPLEIDATSGEMWLRVVGDAFQLHPDRFPDDQGRDLRCFFEGYLEGVIGDIFKAVASADNPIELKVRIITEYQLPPEIRNGGQSTDKVNYYRVSAAGSEDHAQA